MEEKLICGQCNELITEPYINKGEWAQCFSCYEEEYNYIYHSDDVQLPQDTWDGGEINEY